jgi:hypothetical protein
LVERRKDGTALEVLSLLILEIESRQAVEKVSQ